MNKKIIEKSQDYTLYEDYSAEVKCQTCGTIEIITSERYQKLTLGDSNKLNGYQCLSCWKKSRDEANRRQRMDIDERIAWNSAVNNAVNSLGEQKGSLDEEEIIKRAKIIYKIIKNKN